MSTQNLAHISLIVANILMGLSFSYFVSVIKEYLSFENLFYLRIVLAAIFFSPFVVANLRKGIVLGSVPLWHFVAGAAMIIFGVEYLQLFGAGYTTAVSAASLAMLAPIATLTLSHFLNREPIYALKLLGVSLAVAGGLMMIFISGIPSDKGMGFGNMLIAISSIFMGCNTVVVKPFLMSVGTGGALGMIYLLGLIVATPIFLEGLLEVNFKAIPMQGLLQIAFIIIFSTILPNILLYYGTNKLTSIHTGLYSYLQPITAAVISAIRGRGIITTREILPILLVIVGAASIIAVYKKHGFPMPPDINNLPK